MTRTVDIPDDLMAVLKQVAEAQHRSVNSLLIVAAEEYIARHSQRVRALAAGRQIVELDRELLDRLAR